LVCLDINRSLVRPGCLTYRRGSRLVGLDAFQPSLGE
jgi:hypothetical protein